MHHAARGVLIAILALGGAAAEGRQAKPPAVGDPAPDVEVRDLAGKAWTLAELRKRAPSGVVSLTFWCTFCHSCRLIDARFQKAAVELRDKAAVLGVDASAADTPAKVEAFRREKKLDVPIFLDADGKAADVFGVALTTTTVVLDARGVLRYRGRFEPGMDALKALIEGKDVALPETPPAG